MPGPMRCILIWTPWPLQLVHFCTAPGFPPLPSHLSHMTFLLRDSRLVTPLHMSSRETPRVWTTSLPFCGPRLPRWPPTVGGISVQGFFFIKFKKAWVCIKIWVFSVYLWLLQLSNVNKLIAQMKILTRTLFCENNKMKFNWSKFEQTNCLDYI